MIHAILYDGSTFTVCSISRPISDLRLEVANFVLTAEST